MPLWQPDPIWPVLQARHHRQPNRRWISPGPAPPPGLLDNFTGADGTALTSHTSDDGKTWSVQSGSTSAGTIQSNRLYSTVDTQMIASGTNVADAEITTQVYIASSLSSNLVGPGGRLVSGANTGVWAAVQNFSGVWSTNLFHFLAGAFASYGTGGVGTQPSIGSTHTLMLKMLGTQISLYWDGALSTGPFTTGITAAGGIGIRITAETSTTGMHLDNISAI